MICSTTLYFSLFNSTGNNTFGYFIGESLNTQFEHIILFALVWNFGAVVNKNSRQLFDKFLRQKIDDNNVQVPIPP